MPTYPEQTEVQKLRYALACAKQGLGHVSIRYGRANYDTCLLCELNYVNYKDTIAMREVLSRVPNFDLKEYLK